MALCNVWYDGVQETSPALGDGHALRYLSHCRSFRGFWRWRHHAGEAEIKAAQQTIDSQLKAFQAGDDETRLFLRRAEHQADLPDRRIFMAMVASGYQPVHRPKNYSFGKVEEMGPTSHHPAGDDRRPRRQGL